jgi:hypothetical protein
MADKKISELNSLTGANAADGDLVAIVDVSATETKKITRSEFFTNTPSIDVNVKQAIRVKLHGMLTTFIFALQPIHGNVLRLLHGDSKRA